MNKGVATQEQTHETHQTHRDDERVSATDELLGPLATLLARGYLRHLARSLAEGSVSQTEDRPETAESGLDQAAETPLAASGSPK